MCFESKLCFIFRYLLQNIPLIVLHYLDMVDELTSVAAIKIFAFSLKYYSKKTYLYK